LVSGENKVRVIQRTSGGKERKTPNAEVVSKSTPVTFSYDKGSKSIKFSSETGYEVYDEFGRIVKRGNSSWVDLSNAPRGDYYISYDNKTDKFSKK
jgi:hypothetical protein